MAFLTAASSGSGQVARKVERLMTMPGVAESALDRSGVNKGLLDRVKMIRIIGQPFNGHHFTPLDLGGQHKAGETGGSVHPDGAGPALAGAASLFGAGEFHIFP